MFEHFSMYFRFFTKRVGESLLAVVVHHENEAFLPSPEFLSQSTESRFKLSSVVMG